MLIKEIISEAKINIDNMRLIRVQPDMRGVGQDKKGIFLFRYDKKERNTMHFVINGVVSSHEAGNWDKASVTIIANPKSIETPMAGITSGDVWYHLDDEGKLYLGDDVEFLVPEGQDTAVDLNVPARFRSYFPSWNIKTYKINRDKDSSPMDSRDAAVHNLLKQQDIDPLDINRTYATNLEDPGDTVRAIQKKYGAGEAEESLHTHSQDGALEHIFRDLSGALVYARTKSFYFHDAYDKHKWTPMPHWISWRIETARKFIDDYRKAKPKQAAVAKSYLAAMLAKCNQLEAEIPKLWREWNNAPVTIVKVVNSDKQPVNIDSGKIKAQELLPVLTQLYVKHGEDALIIVQKDWPHPPGKEPQMEVQSPCRVQGRVYHLEDKHLQDLAEQAIKLARQERSKPPPHTGTMTYIPNEDLPQEIYLGINGIQSGPFTPQVVKQKVKSGQIDTDKVYVWWEELHDWQLLNKYPELSRT